MRFFEFLPEQEQGQKVATNAPLTATKDQHPADAQPAVAVPPASPPQETQPNYADYNAYVNFEGVFKQELIDNGATDVKIENRKPEKGRLPHYRLDNVSEEQLQATMTNLGFTETDPTDIQSASSGKWAIYSYEADGTVYTILIRGFKNKGEAGGSLLNQKELTPTNIGLTGKTFTSRQELADAAKAGIAQRFKDQQLVSALSELTDNALAGGTNPLSPENLAYIKSKIKIISQDYGEVLAPLILAKDGEPTIFPAGNEKLIDVTVGGTKYSVKALTGSGTSMNSLGDLLDEYELTMTDAGKKQLFQNGVKIWRSTRKEGSVLDRLCLASYKNKTPEYIAFSTILGSDFVSYKSPGTDDNGKQLPSLLSLIQAKTGKLDYSNFLKTIYPAMTAGKWAKPTGLPDDGKYYIGLTDKKPKAGIAGKFSYDNDPIDGAGNIICYSLGQALQNMIKRGPNSAQYKSIMTDMVKTLNCRLAHVTIKLDGSITVTSESFSNLDFDFDYHAPSHKAGNNRPGFMIVRPGTNVKKKGQATA